jgi:type II secretory pathway component PulC
MDTAQQEEPVVTSVWPSIILRCAQLIFAALIVAALASTVSFARVPPVPVAPPAREVPLSSGERAPLESFAVIAQRNVFRHKGGRPVEISGTLPRTALELELVGTLVAGEGRRWYSLAIVKDARDQVMVVREGQLFVAGRIRVVSIESRRIVIENAGLLEVLSLASEREEQQLRSQPPGLATRTGEASPLPTAGNDTSVLESLRARARPTPRAAAR